MGVRRWRAPIFASAGVRVDLRSGRRYVFSSLSRDARLPFLSMPEFITRIASLLQVDPQVVLRRLLTIAVIWGLAWLG